MALQTVTFRDCLIRNACGAGNPCNLKTSCLFTHHNLEIHSAILILKKLNLKLILICAFVYEAEALILDESYFKQQFDVLYIFS